MAGVNERARPSPPKDREKAEKIRRVNAEYVRLMESFKDLPADVLAVVDGLIVEAANMRITLEDLRNNLDETGWIEMFRQSERLEPYEKKRAQAEIYLNMNPAYQKIIDKLTSFIPKPEPKSEPDDFEVFVAEARDV